MPTYPHGPKILKGAIVALSDTNPQPQTIAFQYNPETVKRSLQPQTVGGDQGERSQVVRYTGAPVETIELEVYIDAVDALEQGDSNAASAGIHPQLALLEMLAYPSSQQVIQNDNLLAMGMLEIAPLVAPLTLFVWGPNRVLPVRLTSLSISEELFDTNLNPIRATLSLSIRALSYSDLARDTRGYNLFLAYQQAKESMAAQGPQGSSAITGVDVSRFF
jgi:Contractile injection system tube protein